MSLITAPYNGAMRLGSGFNSYTQQLCINNAVIKENKEPASLADLVPSSSNDETSQSVKWSGRFVSNSKDVLDSLDISGALSIKYAGSKGGRGEGSYLKTSRIEGSDINYFLEVTVVNQRLVAADVTKFNAVPNSPVTKFTDVYGDSFISGFLEGGTFRALVSVIVNDKEDITEIKGEIEASLSASGLDVEAKAKGGFKAKNKTKNTETTISVEWSGGGKMQRESAVQQWTIEALGKAAFAFPEKCAVYPQYTHAILTKYTALRSYQELANKGTPLDYENAGVYTRSLLDSYLTYKQIWTELDLMTANIQGNLREYTKNQDKYGELKSYASEAQEIYHRQCRAFYSPEVPPQKTIGFSGVEDQSSASAVDASVSKKIDEGQSMLAKVEHAIIVAKKKLQVIEKGEHFEPPLKPNSMQMYNPTVLGLDQARRDCRWEMIKIVKEVDAVTNDPNVAIDPDRMWQYLNPVIFRQLLPKPDPEHPPFSKEYLDNVIAKYKKGITIACQRLVTARRLLGIRKAQLDHSNRALSISNSARNAAEVENQSLTIEKDNLQRVIGEQQMTIEHNRIERERKDLEFEAKQKAISEEWQRKHEAIKTQRDEILKSQAQAIEQIAKKDADIKGLLESLGTAKKEAEHLKQLQQPNSDLANNLEKEKLAKMALEKEIASLKQLTDHLETDVSRNESSVTNLKQKISDLEADVSHGHNDVTKLTEDKTRLQGELHNVEDRLRQSNERVMVLESEFKNKENDIERLNKEKMIVDERMRDRDNDYNRLLVESKSVDEYKRVQTNNLGDSFNGKTVMFVDVMERWSMDLGGEERNPGDGSKWFLFNWNYDRGSGNQHFKLCKLGNGNWTIQSESKGTYLTVSDTSDNTKIYGCERDDRDIQEWRICWAEGGAWIESVHHLKMVIDKPTKGNENKNGGKLGLYQRWKYTDDRSPSRRIPWTIKDIS